MTFDAYTLKVEVGLRLDMLSEQMGSKLVEVHLSKSDFMPYGCSANKNNIHPTPSLDLCVGSASISYLCPRICQVYLPCVLLSFDSN